MIAARLYEHFQLHQKHNDEAISRKSGKIMRCSPIFKYVNKRALQWLTDRDSKVVLNYKQLPVNCKTINLTGIIPQDRLAGCDFENIS